MVADKESVVVEVEETEVEDRESAVVFGGSTVTVRVPNPEVVFSMIVVLVLWLDDDCAESVVDEDADSVDVAAD